MSQSLPRLGTQDVAETDDQRWGTTVDDEPRMVARSHSESQFRSLAPHFDASQHDTYVKGLRAVPMIRNGHEAPLDTSRFFAWLGIQQVACVYGFRSDFDD